MTVTFGYGAVILYLYSCEGTVKRYMARNAESFGMRKELLESIISLAEKYDIGRLYLFGSRARGDYRERSDIDLAAAGGRVSDFCLDVEEETPTLLLFDVVNLDNPIDGALKDELDKDGILLYEKVR